MYLYFTNACSNNNKKLDYNNLINVTILYKVASSFAASAANVLRSVLLELQTLFRNCFTYRNNLFRRYTVKHFKSTKSRDVVSKNFPKSVVYYQIQTEPQFSSLNLRKAPLNHNLTTVGEDNQEHQHR